MFPVGSVIVLFLPLLCQSVPRNFFNLHLHLKMFGEVIVIGIYSSPFSESLLDVFQLEMQLEKFPLQKSSFPGDLEEFRNVQSQQLRPATVRGSGQGEAQGRGSPI